MPKNQQLKRQRSRPGRRERAKIKLQRVEIAGLRTPAGLVTDFEIVAEHSIEIRDDKISERAGAGRAG